MEKGTYNTILLINWYVKHKIKIAQQGYVPDTIILHSIKGL